MIRSLHVTPLVCLIVLLGTVVLLCCGPASPANEPADSSSADSPSVNTTATESTAAVTAPDVVSQEIPVPTASDGFVGPRSCSATACHGAVQPDRGGVNHNGNPLAGANAAGILRNEFLVWLEDDPHSSAAATLVAQRSQDILRRLHALDERGEPMANYQRYMKNCIACHSPQTAPAAIATAGVRELAVGQGVTCESCHGAAAAWVDDHYSRRWASYDAAKKSAAGMIDTANLLRRAEACATCHVGAPGMEVNHDLIAAGHPPLKFEFTAYLDLLPKHWNEAKERAETPDFESQSWLAGQVACARAALELLQWRSDPAQQAATGGPVWPEFAELDCYACHHDLESPSWRIERGFGGGTPGRLRWGSWYLTMPRLLAGDHAFSTSTATLAGEMGNSVASIDSVTVHRAVEQTRGALADWLETAGLARMLQNNAAALSQPQRDQLWRGIASVLDEQADTSPIDNWEIAAQVYLMLVALDRERASSSAAALQKIRLQLAFEAGPDDDTDFVFQSPKRFSQKRDELKDAILDLLQVTLKNTPDEPASQ